MIESVLVNRATACGNARRIGAAARASWILAAAVFAGGPLAALAQEPPEQQQPTPAQQQPSPAQQLLVAQQPTAAQQSADAGPSTAAQAPLQEVTVTGTRLTLLPGMATPTPVTSVPAAQMLSIGAGDIIQGLSLLPSLSGTVTPQTQDGGTTAGQGDYLNLRRLGQVETLVLLDGIRVMPLNTANDVDVSMIPQALVSRVDVVTGGASAAYGSDAVAGVVNFVLNTHYTGFKIDVGHGESGVGDGARNELSMAWGAPFLNDRAHVIASFNWIKSDAADYNLRPWADGHCALINNPGVTTATMSPDHPLDIPACNVTEPYASSGGAIISGPLTSATQGISFGPGGVPNPFVYGADHTSAFQVGGTGDPIAVGDTFSFINPRNNMTAFSHVDYDVSDDVQAFAQVMMGRSTAEYPETASNFAGTTRPFTIYSGNPFIPSSIQSEMTALNVPSFQLGIDPLSWGLILANEHEETYDALAGLKGAFGKGWSWEVHYDHGHTEWTMTQPNNPDLSNLYRAVDAVTAPNGTTVCESALVDPAAYSGCVPIDLFGQGAASPQALAYIMQGNTPLLDEDTMVYNDATATINGTPFSLWAGPISFAFGVEWRQLLGIQSTDAISQEYPVDFTDVRGVPSSIAPQDGGWLTSNPQPYSGEYTVKESFLEFEVPLAKDVPFAKELDLNAAGRLTDYSQSGLVETWKAGMTWQPVNDLLFRATESRDIRAPNIANLYAGLSTGSENVTDPFEKGGTYFVRFSTLGNTNLVPERATTFTGGLTYQPSWLSGFAFSADYYDIRITDLISSYSAQQELNYCYEGDTALCSNILRQPDGIIYLILQPTLNLNQAATEGVDLDVSYHKEVLGGALTTRLIGTHVITQSTTDVTPTGNIEDQNAGNLSAGSPSWLLTETTSYDRGPIGVDLTGRFVSSGVLETTDLPGTISPAENQLPSNFTLDVGLRYTLASLPGTPEFYLTITNVLNKAPPLIPGSLLTSVDTNPTLYDIMGRYFFGGVRMSF